MNRFFSLFLVALLVGGTAFAELKTQVVEYKAGGVVMEGYLAYDDASKDKRPGVLVVHEWNGLGKYVKSRTEQLAKMGYVAFAADIYGKGVRPETMEACQVESGKYRNNRGLMRKRAKAALKELSKNPLVDAKKLASIGYCFGGTTSLELARTGADLKGVASFHGGLGTPDPKDAKKIKGKVLVLQGGADDFTLKEIEGFEKEMKDAKVDYKLVTYKGAKHGFTNPEYKGMTGGVAYDAKADKASWKELKGFLAEIFK